jgi:hypothetical protein
MRAIETTPAVSLDRGKEQGSCSSDTRSEGQSGDSLERGKTKIGQKNALGALNERPGKLKIFTFRLPVDVSLHAGNLREDFRQLGLGVNLLYL